MFKEDVIVLFHFFVCAVIGVSLFQSNAIDEKVQKTPHFNISNAVCSNTPDDRETILSYEDVLRSYYKEALDHSKDYFTYEDFRDGYYSEDNDLEFFDYVDSLCSEPLFVNNNNVSFEDTKSNGREENPERSSGDEDYILSDNYYGTTPTSEFTRRPYNLAFSYTSLRKGDLVFESEPLSGIGHIGIIINKSKNSESYGAYIQTVEAVNSGVKYGFFDDLRIIEKKMSVLRVVGYTFSKANAACEFADDQIGASYGNPFELTWQTEDSDHWFCSELVYAAWKRQDIDILQIYDQNHNVVMPTYCWPIDIFNSFNTTELNIDRYQYLSVNLVGKDWNKWVVQIRNVSSYEVHVSVNRKMCFENDAKNWVNLNDLVSFYMDPGEYFNFYIETNWFATHIALCFVVGQIRFITYGYNLTESWNNYSIDTGNEIKEA